MLNPGAPPFYLYPHQSFQSYYDPIPNYFSSYSCPLPLPLFSFPLINVEQPCVYRSTWFCRSSLPAQTPPPYLHPFRPSSFNLANISSCNNEVDKHDAKEEEIEAPKSPTPLKEEKTTPCSHSRFHKKTSYFCFKDMKSMIWRPKLQDRSPVSPFNTDHPKVTSTRKPKPKLQNQISASRFVHDHSKTTLMIKNIPNRYTSLSVSVCLCFSLILMADCLNHLSVLFSREMLLELLDGHCAEENGKSKMGTSSSNSSSNSSSLSEYDFVYLPFDFVYKRNLGYAFVNFTTAEAAKKLYMAMHNYKWGILTSKKICEITYARIQGKESLIRNFRDSIFVCESDEFLPILLSPPRNGSTSCPEPILIGTRNARP